MKTQSKKILVILLCAVLALTLAAGCGASSGGTGGSAAPSASAAPASSQPAAAGDGEVALEMWSLETPPNRVEAYQDLINAFMAENSGTKVDLKIINWGEAFPKLLTSIQAGTGPDVVQCSPDITITVKELGVVQPVEDVVQRVKDTYGLYDAPIKPYDYEDHIWAVPMWTQSMMLYYRADLLAEAGITPPKTWDELLAAAEKLTTSDRFGIGIPTSKHMYADQVFYSFMTTAKADIYDKGGNVSINSPETVKTLDFYKQLAAFAPKDSSSWTWAESEQALAADKIAMTVAFGNVLERAFNDAPDIAKNIESVGIPVPDGGQPGTISYAIGLMVLSQDEMKIEASKKLIEFAHTPDANAAWLNKMAAGCFLPATEATAKSPVFMDNEIVKTFEVAIKSEIESSQHGKMFGFTSDVPVPTIGSVTGANIISEMSQKVAFGQTDAATAAAEAEALIKSYE